MVSSLHNLVIIGSGPAGLTAGIYAARANIQPIIIEGSSPGGQLLGTTYIENWPGEQRIFGPELMKNMREQAEYLGCTFVEGDATSVDFKNSPLSISTKNKTLSAQAVVIATGATPKRLKVPGEDAYWGKGVTTCAVCDGAFYPNKPVVIVGGGDTAMEDASFMANYTDHITVIHILDKLTASHAMQERVVKNKKIKIIYTSTVTEIRGSNEHVTEVVITNQRTQEQTTLPTAAVFVAIGLQPNTDIFKGQLALTKYGYIDVQETTKTSVPGVFVAGDVADFRYRQAITAAGAGCMAALDAERYLGSR